ncbi:MAG: helix-turn-helix transcriptional regulator [Bacteroidota bacterium]
MNLGRAIREIRKSKSIGQEELASLSGITQARLSQIENGEKPGEETLNKICEILKIAPPLVYVMAFDKEDYPAENGELYDRFHLIIEGLVKQVASVS